MQQAPESYRQDEDIDGEKVEREQPDCLGEVALVDVFPRP